MSRRKLARPGDRIAFDYRTGQRLSGTVTKKASDYLYVDLDAPRELEEWEREYPATADPMKCSVYLRSSYVIEEAGNGR